MKVVCEDGIVRLTRDEVETSQTLRDYADSYSDEPYILGEYRCSHVINLFRDGFPDEDPETCLSLADFLGYTQGIIRFSNVLATTQKRTVAEHLQSYILAFQTDLPKLLENERLLRLRLELEPQLLLSQLQGCYRLENIYEKCISKGYYWIVRLMLNTVAKEHATAIQHLFLVCVTNGQVDSVKLLLEHESSRQIVDVNFDRCWPLSNAIHNGNEEITKLLLENGAIVMTNSYNDHVKAAIDTDNTEILSLLLERGVDINAKDDEYFLHACYQNARNVIEFLVSRHNANMYQDRGFPMKIMIRYGNLDSVKMFLDRGFDIHVENDRALRQAAKCQNPNMLRLLLSRGANAHAKDDMAFFNVCKRGTPECLEVFLEDPYFREPQICKRGLVVAQKHHNHTVGNKLLVLTKGS